MRIVVVMAALALMAGSAWAQEGGRDAVRIRALNKGLTQAVVLDGKAYRDFSADDTQARFIVAGSASAQVTEMESGPISRVSIAPLEPASGADSAGTPEYSVCIDFRRPPSSSLINQVDGTLDLPDAPQVIVGFTFAPERSRARPMAGGRSTRDTSAPGEPGRYKLPQMPKAHYSDALVTLRVTNADFREILFLMSEIGQVSIVFDPYWNDEPTGSRRPVGGGAGGSGGSLGGGSDPGYRPGGNFDPGGAPREGAGNLSLNFDSVPFDLALDLILQSVGLVKVDIYPDSYK